MTSRRINCSEIFTRIFHNVICANNIETLKNLLQDEDLNPKKTFDINKVIKNKSTALHLAIANKNVDMVRLLLEHDARIDLKNEAGNNCLELAAKLGEHDLVNLCLQRVGWIYGLKYPIECKISPLKQKFTKSIPYDSDYNIYDVFQFLLSNKADPNIQCPFNKNTPLHNIMGKGPAENNKELRIRLIKLLLDYGADPNVKNNAGRSPFHLSFKSNDTNLVYCFITHGANLYPRKYKEHAVYLAVSHGMHEVLQKLIKLQRGANKFHVDPFPIHETRLQLCFIEPTGYKNPKNCVAIIKLLIEHGVDVNRADVAEQTPLYCAARSGCFEAVKYLVEMGADLNGHSRNRPLFAAVHHGHLKIVEFLISRGANLDLGNRYDYSLLYYSARLLRLSVFNCAIEWNLTQYNIIKSLFEKGLRIGKNDGNSLQSWQFKILNSHQEEIMSMKKMKICENLEFTYFDLLIQRRNALVSLLLFKEVKIAMRSGHYKKLFVNFGDRLETNYKEGLKRLLKSVALRMMLSAVFPCNVIAKIINYLSDEELENIFQ